MSYYINMPISRTDSQKAAFNPVEEANLRLKINRLEEELLKSQSDLRECLKKQDGFKNIGNVKAKFLGELSKHKKVGLKIKKKSKKGKKSKRR
jgi:hypothetical protein